MKVRHLVVVAALVSFAASGLSDEPRRTASKMPSWSGPHQAIHNTLSSRQAQQGLDTQRLIADFARLPLGFEANQGQADSQVKFLARGPGYTLFLTATEAVFRLHSPVGSSSRFLASGERHRHKNGVVRLKLTGANPSPQITAAGQLPGRVNYFRGNDPNAWHTSIPTYANIRYRNVYPGVDLVYYGNQGQLEYDFVVQPGSNPEVITIRFDGQLEGDAPVGITGDGEIWMRTGAGDFRLRPPFAYQSVEGVQKPVPVSYRFTGKREVGFAVGGYDRSRELVIDPVLVFSTFFGGSSDEFVSEAFSHRRMSLKNKS